MRKFIDIIEAHYDYGQVEYDTEFSPLLDGDTVTVYHGFRDFVHAVSLARHGLSGKCRVPRVYSYESDNNPCGLFVTLSKKTAAEFVGAYDNQAMVELRANVGDLEAPVWPGGSYTVQGQYSQYFGHGPAGRSARNQRRVAAGQEIDKEVENDPERLDHVAKSDNRLLAYMLTNSREHQALFVGHLNPSEIVCWHVRPKDSYNDDAWEKISNEEFLSRYADVKISKDDKADMRVFLPDEDFDGEQMIERIAKRHAGGNIETVRSFVKSVRDYIAESTNKRGTFLSYFGMYLWPKQEAAAMRWIARYPD